jgi:hypothetical protein
MDGYLQFYLPRDNQNWISSTPKLSLSAGSKPVGTAIKTTLCSHKREISRQVYKTASIPDLVHRGPHRLLLGASRVDFNEPQMIVC